MMQSLSPGLLSTVSPDSNSTPKHVSWRLHSAWHSASVISSLRHSHLRGGSVFSNPYVRR